MVAVAPRYETQHWHNHQALTVRSPAKQAVLWLQAVECHSHQLLFDPTYVASESCCPPLGRQTSSKILHQMLLSPRQRVSKVACSGRQAPSRQLEAPTAAQPSPDASGAKAVNLTQQASILLKGTQQSSHAQRPHLPCAKCQLALSDWDCERVAQHHGQQVGVSIFRLLKHRQTDEYSKEVSECYAAAVNSRTELVGGSKLAAPAYVRCTI